MVEKPGYRYFSGNTAELTITEKHRADASFVGRETLDPKLSNVDYLVLRERAKIIRRWSESFPEERMTILDVGGRIQPYSPLFERITKVYIATDLQFEGLIDVLAHAERLPFESESIDLVICTQVLSYLRKPHLAIGEIYRVLAPGGHLIVSAPSFFPEHHDEQWRFLPVAYENLLEKFGKLTIEPEGNSAKGLLRALNVTLHADIEGYRIRKLAENTSIPIINLLGLALGLMANKNTRCTANYCVLARK